MYYNVVVTYECNKRCRYCGLYKLETPLPKEITYSIEELKRFIEKDLEPVITFYGGEPLLRIKTIETIMDNIKAKRFMLQTNGIFLHMLRPRYLRRFHTILLSIDGSKKITDFYRGEGTYDKVIENAKLIRKRGFKGNLIARMTVSEETDIFNEVKWLLFLKEPKFDFIFWQLNMMFGDIKLWRDPNYWIKNKYNPGIVKLIKFWLKAMFNSKVYKILPFLAIMRDMLQHRSSKLRCGAGFVFFTIATNGNISPCPVTAEFNLLTAGNIKETSPSELYDSFKIGMPCTKCKFLYICGGRCLFANYFKPWGEHGYKMVCSTVKNMINSLLKIKPIVERLIKENVISLNDFEYTEFDGCEIIP